MLTEDGELPKKDRVRCPACGSVDLVLTEISTVGMPFHQCPDGSLRRIESNTEPEICKVEASCTSCRHGWTLRKMSAGIGELPGKFLAGRRTCGCEHT